MTAWVRLPDFECVICKQVVDMRWHVRASAATNLEPICSYCETQYGSGIAKPKHGSFRDRREVMRGFALAEALRCAAMQKEWNSHGIA